MFAHLPEDQEQPTMPAQVHIQRVALLILAALFTLSACNVNVKKDEQGEDKNVDIKTPFGQIHVDKGADVKDTGLPVYAGARVKQKGDNEGDEKNANVNISTGAFGIRVVAVEYESDDAPAKLIAYYKDQLKKYGTVLECHTTGQDFSYHGDPHSEELKCEGNTGKNIELKAGTKNNQHIVSIEPRDKGADFALVYVHIRGKEDTI
jgi:hypothetical protein